MAPRLALGGERFAAWLEEAEGAEARRKALDDKGWKVASARDLGAVNLIHCPTGLPRRQSYCLGEADRRGFGIVVRAD